MTALAWWTFVIAPALSVLLWLAYECVEAPLVDEDGQPIDPHVEAAFNRWADEAVALTEEERP